MRQTSAADTREQALDAALRGEPCTVGEEYAEDVVAAVEGWREQRGKEGHTGGGDGPCGLSMLCDGRWDAFPRKRVCMRGGALAPGTPVVDEAACALVGAFSEVVAAGEGARSSDNRSLNLQMFHRGEDETGSVPALPALLRWPLAEEMHGDEEDGRMATRATPLSHFCDMATRVSSAGATTWWHLDDGGEVTLQVGLPLSDARHASPGAPPLLLGPGGRPAVKLFFFASIEDYAVVTQDPETHRTGRFAALHPFAATPTDFPAALRPRLTLAVLEAGGRPLLSPPNMPHIVITLCTCAMVEMRRVVSLLMDEVLYFLERAAEWAEPPILYPVITESLQDETRTLEMAEALMRVLEGDDTAPALRCRAYHALLALEAGGEKGHFAGATASLRDKTAAARGRAVTAHGKGVAAPDERAAMHARALSALELERMGVAALPRGGAAAYAHDARGLPLWGPVRASIDAAGRDRRDMTAAKKQGLLRELVEAYRQAEAGEGDQ